MNQTVSGGRAAPRAGVLAHAVAIGVVLALCWAAKPVFITLLVSVMLAFLLEPIARALQHVKVTNALASLLADLVLLGALYGVGVLVYGQAQEFLGNLPSYSRQVRESVRSLRRQTEQLRDTVLPVEKGRTAPAPAADGLQMILGGLGTVTQLAVISSFVPFLVYFMLSWRRHVYDAIVHLFPADDRDKVRSSLDAITSVIRQFIIGNLIVGVIVGAASALVFAILGVPEFLVVGALSGFLSVVPYLGAVLALLPPFVAGAAGLTGTTAFAITATVLALHVVALNILYPMLIGRRVSVNPLVNTVALLFWGWLWGGFGLVLAIPLTGAMKAVFDHVEGLRGWGALLGDQEIESG